MKRNFIFVTVRGLRVIEQSNSILFGHQTESSRKFLEVEFGKENQTKQTKRYNTESQAWKTHKNLNN